MRARICSMICSTFTESERTLKSAMSNVKWELNGMVNDQHHRQRPQRHADEKRAIDEQQVRRTSAAFALMHKIQVPEDAVERKGNGQPEPVRPELLLRFRADRVEHVRDERRGRHDREHL